MCSQALFKRSLQPVFLQSGSGELELVIFTVFGGPQCSKKGEARKETDRLCSDNETGGGDGKAERENLKN
jgi:hypothetical protein